MAKSKVKLFPPPVETSKPLPPVPVLKEESKFTTMPESLLPLIATPKFDPLKLNPAGNPMADREAAVACNP